MKVPWLRILPLLAVLSLACNAWTSSEASTSAPSPRRIKVDRASMPLLALTESERERFRQGDALFEATLRESDGLGPLYVRDSCNACHASDGRGPGIVTKVAPRDGNLAVAKQLLPWGATERPYTAAGAKTALLAPNDARLMVTQRLPPAVFGRGYLEAISDADLLRLEATAKARTGSARGRLNRLEDGSIGRFGTKARIATLQGFAADALSGDMGISSPQHPEEQPGPEGLQDDVKPGVDFSAEQVALLGDYLQRLEIPARQERGERGLRLFGSARCTECHEPSFRTSPAHPIAALAGVEADVYTDLLLHDMGQAMSDGVTEEDAGPRDYRTAPLIGLRFLPSLLHDGRAKTVEQAILAHGAPDSEGRDSVRAFQALSEPERQELVKFVEAL
jgi:CxxC motif-containing protein (DUF1111 family)